MPNQPENYKFRCARLAAIRLCALLLGLSTAASADDRLISRFFADHTAIMLLIDPTDGQILDANHRAEQFYGMSLADLRNLRIDDINAHPPDEISRRRAQAAAGAREFFVFPHRTRYQGVRSVAVYSSPVDLPSGQQGLLSIIHDINDHLIPEEDSEAYREELERLVDQAGRELIDQRDSRIVLQRWLLGIALLVIVVFALAYRSRVQVLKQLERASFEARKLKIAVDQSPASIVITDCDGTIEYVNQTCINNAGYSRNELVGNNPRELQSGTTPQQVYADLWATIKAGRTWQGRLVNRRKDGSEFVEWVLINPVLDETDQPIRFIAIKEDITEREELDKRLRSLERFDALTGLANRFAFFEALEKRLEKISDRCTRQPLALINIDRFHSFNAVHGHEMGDRLLRYMARQLIENAPQNSVVARLGPDEFAVLPPLEAAGDDPAIGRRELQWIQRIQRALRQGFVTDSRTLSSSASIGIAFCDHVNEDPGRCNPGDFMRLADSALHEAKNLGGGQIAFFDADASIQAQEALQLEQDLAGAIECGELYLALQAQVQSNGRLVGAEVLLRWHHGTLGEISPGRFIPLAEDSGQIVPIGFWVLQQALSALKNLQQKDPALTLSVNLSPVQIRCPDFVAGIGRMLAEVDVEPSGLILEITESVFMEDPEAASDRLQALRELGVGISIDDFGTGYSSLSYLKRLPVTELKIDQSFVAGLPNDAADRALVNIILSAANELKLQVVAEGIENQAQAQCFDARENVILQGFFYDHPKPVAEWIEKWLSEALTD